MDNKEKKEYLSLYRIYLAKIQRYSELIAENPAENERFKIALKEAKMQRDKIETEIENISNPVLCEILAQKYQCGKTLEEISVSMNYSQRQIERLHIKALGEFIILPYA